MPERPAGVTVLAIIFIVFSVLELIGGVALLAFGGFMAAMMGAELPAEAMGMAGLFTGIFAFFSIILIVFGVIGLAVGVGLLGGNEWARILAIVLGILNIVFGLINIMAGGIISLVFGAIVVWYLMQPNVVSYFKGEGVSG